MEIVKEYEGSNYLEISSHMQVTVDNFIDEILGIDNIKANLIIKFL